MMIFRHKTVYIDYFFFWTAISEKTIKNTRSMNLLNTWQWIHPPNIHIGTTATGIKTQYPSYCENVSITAHCLFSKLNHPHLLHNLTWFLITKKKYILIRKLHVDWHAHEISTLKRNFFVKILCKKSGINSSST